MSVHQKALDKAKIQLMLKKDSAFFTTLCFNMKHIWDETIPTACTDGLTIRYSVDFFMSLTPPQQLFLLLHETLHVAFDHMGRRGTRDPRKWNIAGDYVINYILVQRGFIMPEGGLYDPQYAGMGAEDVYDLLPPDAQLPDLPMDDVGLSAGGDGDAEAQQAAQETKEKVDDLLIQASLQAKMAGDAPGSIPGQLQFYIDSLMAPKLPWNQILRKFMTKAIKKGYTWKRPNRRYFPQHYLPSRNSKALCNITVAIDTSCSVTDAEFHRFTSEVYSILKQQKPTSLTLIQFDTDLKSITDVTSPKDLMSTVFTGRGGTDIHPVIDWATHNKPTVLLVFSDGCFHQRYANPNVPIVWLINDNPTFEAKAGKVIHYESK